MIAEAYYVSIDSYTDWKLLKLRSSKTHTKLSMASCSSKSLTCLWVHAGLHDLVSYSASPSVTHWWNDLSLARKGPVQIKLLPTQIRYWWGSGGLLLSARHIYLFQWLSASSTSDLFHSPLPTVCMKSNITFWKYLCCCYPCSVYSV